MKRRPFVIHVLLVALLSLGLAGCSRTIDDIGKWKAKGNIEKLVKALGDPKPEIRIAAAEALGELKAEPAVDALAALYNDSEAAAVLAAVKALAAINTPATTTPLIAALKLDQVEARLVAAQALGTQKATAAIDPLIEALGDSDEAVQHAAVLSLGQIGDEKASPALVAKLGSDSEKMRLACVDALALTGGKAAAQGLVDSLADQSAAVREAAIATLAALAEHAKPLLLEALKDERTPIRSGAIAVLKKINAIPTAGADSIWYQLAQVSVDDKDAIDADLVAKLAKKGDDAIGTLLEACAHNVADFREHAFRALERIGEPATAKAVAAAANAKGKNWFAGRTAWAGAPSWRIDLWAALTALNPQFEIDAAKAAAMQAQGRNAFRAITASDFKPAREYIPQLIGLLGDQTLPPPVQPDVDEDGVPVIKTETDRFRGEANQLMSINKLVETKDLGVLPLIAAAQGRNPLIAGNAAEILGEIGDPRALQPLIDVLNQKIAAGEQLSTSPFYNALQKLDDPAAEPVLLKVRPNSDRAMRVFDRHYGTVRVMSAESRDASSEYTQPITFRLGYISGGRLIETPVTFARDGFGDWKPSPALPADLPQ